MDIFFEKAFYNSVKYSHFRSNSCDDFNLKPAHEIISQFSYMWYILNIDKYGIIQSVNPTNDINLNYDTLDTKDTKDTIVLSNKQFEHYLRSYYLVSSSDTHFYIILCDNWSLMPNKPKYWISNNTPRCKELWEKWDIFIEYSQPFSYTSLDWSTLKALREIPVSNSDKLERNRIIIEILKNRDNWVYHTTNTNTITNILQIIEIAV